MYQRSIALWELQSGINAGRLRLAGQFATMDGWQAKQDHRFDDYIREKRHKQHYDAFDQRVERAYNAAAKTHRAEILNSFKRRLKQNNDKYTAATTLQMRDAVEERLRWLRDVWSQIDADYRSSDPARQEVAAKEISAVLHGEPGDYMRWVYEQKREQRFSGEKQRATLAAEMEGAELPEVSNEEANRYHSLRVNMAEIERNVVDKYGVAGQQHWAELQSAKDDLYERKLDEAAEIYKELLDQSSRYDENRRTALLRSNVERVHEAQVRFKASMELETERERMIEAHEAMRESRKRTAKEERVQALKEAAELRVEGRTSGEVLSIMRERQLENHARRQSEYQLREQRVVQRKRSEYLDMIEQFKNSVEEREGLELLAQAKAAPEKRRNAFGFADEDRTDNIDDALATDGMPSHLQSSSSSSPLGVADDRAATTAQPNRSIKRQLWEAIKADNYEDPTATVHQARLDAAKQYDPIYSHTFVTNLAQGKKYSRQGMGEMAAGNAMDRQVLQMGGRNPARSFTWGIHAPVVHDLDGDGDTNYFMNATWHIQDKETGDVDWRYERKSGGAVFRGPRFYRIGAERDAADPGMQTMDPHPPTAGDRQLERMRKERGGAGALPASSVDWRSS